MMKKIFALVVLLVLGKMSYSQYPLVQNLGSDSTLVLSKGGLKGRLVVWQFTDTANANTQRISQYPGALITTASGNLWLRNAAATQWLPIASGSGNNIYTIDGTLLTNRTLTGAGFKLTFDSLSKFVVNTSDSILFNTPQFNVKNLFGDLSVEGTASGGSASSSLTLKTDSDGSWTIKTGTVGFEVGDLRFYDNVNGGGNARVIFKSTGKVGIGTESPDSLLSVNGGFYVGGGIRAPGLPQAVGTKQLRINAQGQISYTDTLIDAGGTVTSVATNNGSGITGGPITTTGTLAIDTTNVIATKASVAGGLAGKLNISDTANMLNPYLRKADTTSMLSPYLRSNVAAATYVPQARTITINGTTQDLSANRTYSVGTVTSVGLTMPAAFAVAGSPVTGSGTLAVTGAGLASQYIRGDGTLANFPGGGGGGGSSVSYYLNGSVNQGTFVGNTYYQMANTPVIGAGTDFNIAADGYITQFITNAGNPALLNIPAGNWNFEMYFSASSGGGSPSFYVELYKYDGTAFTLIASSSASPELITGGTAIDLYTTALAVPATSLTLTDRLAVRIYVTHSGRTITLHTENSHLCQVITTFTTGITALNSLTAQVQYLTTGTSGTDFNISSVTDTHTFNLPTASATNRGALSTTDWSTFNNKIGGSLISGYLTKATGTNSIDTSQIYQSSGLIGIGTTTPTQKLTVNGDALINSLRIGRGTGGSNQSNTAVGDSVLEVNTTGNSNTGLGYRVLEANTSGSGNTGIGIGSLQLNTTGQYNTGLGLYTNLLNISGSNNTAGGAFSLYYNTASNNTAYGYSSLFRITTGDYNTAVGGLAGRSLTAGGNNATSTYGVYLGYNTTASADGNTNEVVIGANAGGNGSNSVTIGNSSITKTYLKGQLNIAGTPSGVGTKALRIDGSGNVTSADTLANGVSGSGTTNYVSKFTGTNTVGNSSIFDDGNAVGIGTATPTSYGTIKALTINGTEGGLLDLSGSGVRQFSVYSLSDGSAYLGTTTNASLFFTTNGTPTAALTNAGKFGVGTVTPDSMLTVTQGAYFQRGIRMSGLPTGVGTKQLRIDATGKLSITDTLIDAGGTVTSVATNTATGITGGTITTTGTLAIDTLLISTRAWRQKGVDSLQANINGKVNISDTASMLSPYLRSNVASATYVPQTRTITINGTSQDLSANRTYNVGTVTSVATSTGTGITGGTITSSGTIAADTLLLSTRAWRQKGVDSVAALVSGAVSGTTNYIPKFTSSSAIGNSTIYTDGTSVGIGTTSMGNAATINLAVGVPATTAGGLQLWASPTQTHYVQFGDGTSGADSYRGFLGYLHSSDAMIFGTNASEQMRLTSTGLGIGTSSPAAKLEVNSASGNTQLLVTSTSGTYPYISLAQTGIATWAIQNVATSGLFTITESGVSDRLVIQKTSGNVGIGTSSPAYKLDVAGTVSVNSAQSLIYSSFDDVAALFQRVGTYGGVIRIGRSGVSNSTTIDYPADGTFAVSTAGSERMRLDASGNLGLGVTPSAWGTGSARVAIEMSTGGSSIWAQNFGGNNPSMQLTCNYYEATGGPIYKVSAAASYYQQNAGSHAWYNAPSGTAGNAISFTQAMTLDASGRLTLAGNDFDLNNGNTLHRITNDNTNLLIRADYGNTSANSTIQFSVDGTERMRITSGGNVGIGTTSPNEKQTIYAGSNLTAATTYWANNGNSSTEFFVGQASDAVAALYNRANTSMLFATNNTERMRITSGGELLVGATSSSYSSANRGLIFLNGATNALYGWGVGGATKGYMYHEGTNVYMENSVSGGFFNITQVGAGYIALNTNGSERMRITSGGELLLNTTSDAGDYKLQVNGNVYATGNLHISKTDAASNLQIRMQQSTRQYWDFITDQNESLTLKPQNSTTGEAPAFRVQNSSGTNQFSINTNTSAAEFAGSIKTAAPSGGTTSAKPWKLGAAGVTLGGSNLSGVEVDIDGTIYYLVTGYLPEPEPEPSATAGPSGDAYNTKYEKPVARTSPNEQKIKSLEAEVAELKAMMKVLMNQKKK